MISQHAVRQLLAATEQAVARAFAAEGLSVHLLQTRQAPTTLTTRLRLHHPTRANLQKARSMAPTVEAYLGRGPVRVAWDQGVLQVEVPSPAPVTLPARYLWGEGLGVPLGLPAGGGLEPVGVDFDEVAHLALIGPTGCGKTTAARALAYHLARQNRPSQTALVAFCSPAKEAHDWAPLAPLAHSLGVVTDPKETLAAFRWIQARINNGQPGPHLFVLVDDLPNLLARAGGELAPILADIAAQGRAARIHLILATQRLGQRATGDVLIDSNVPNRLIFRTASAQDAAAFAGRAGAGAERLAGKGAAILILEDGTETAVQVAPVSVSDLAGMAPRRATGRPPWLDPVLSQPGSPSSLCEAADAPALLPVSAGSAPVLTGSGPVLPLEPPDAAARAHLRALYAQLGSKNAAIRAAYGHKNGQTWSWLQMALEEDLP